MKSGSVDSTAAKVRETRDEGPGKADGDQVDRLNSMMTQKKKKKDNRDDRSPDEQLLDAEAGLESDSLPGVAAAGKFVPGGMAGLLNQAGQTLSGLTGSQSGFGESTDKPPIVATDDSQVRAMPTITVSPRDPAEAAPVGQTERVAMSQQIERLVDRILVSAPAADGTTEVRITLDKNLLEGTEIAMIHRPGEGLSVEFMSDKLESQRFLLPNLSALRERLAERTGEAVAVRMSENASSDTGDGRSRNRRNLYEEMSGE